MNILGNASNPPAAAVVSRARLLWLEGHELNRENANWGHFWIDESSPEVAVNKVIECQDDSRCIEAIRSTLMEYFQRLKIETN